MFNIYAAYSAVIVSYLADGSMEFPSYAQLEGNKDTWCHRYEERRVKRAYRSSEMSRVIHYDCHDGSRRSHRMKANTEEE